MIDYQEQPEQGYVELTLDGRIDRESFDDIVTKLGALMDARGKVGILKHIISFGAVSPSVFWEDLKFASRHLRDCGPVAVVSDKKWIEIWTKLAAPFWTSDVRFFETDELPEAREWLAGAVSAMQAAK